MSGLVLATATEEQRRNARAAFVWFGLRFLALQMRQRQENVKVQQGKPNPVRVTRP